mmetsp:Transcript_22356/g.54148  ORF Transcript_22356/g.54148 Transcript_22356/m.54148 type:complete len:750 (+) Transcript_22356:202-2451(+)
MSSSPGPNADDNRRGSVRQPASSTYAGQASLPRLPIPTLEETLGRFPAAVSALLSSSRDDDTNGVKNKEMKECLEEVQQFLSTDGPILQKLLEEYDRKEALGSYVEEFWTDAYLAPDSSVVMNLNPFFVLEDGPDTKTSKSQERRAASLCFSAVKFASSLNSEAIVPDSFRGRPLCMDQFRALFGACRLPESTNKDTVAVNPDSTHVVVLENNQMYCFQALWPDGTVAVNEDDILEILLAIKADASKVKPEVSSRNALGVLTTLSRQEWANARQDIVSSSDHNKTALEIVDGALFILVIDDVIPKDIHEAAANMLHGTYDLRSQDNLIDYQAGSCCNRWYDKLQVIVCQNGQAGINFEHSAIDGHTALRFVSDIFADNVVTFAKSITRTIYSDRSFFPSLIQAEVRRASVENPAFVTPKKLNFDLPQSVLNKIYYAETALSDQIVASDTYVLEFTGFGKTLIVHNKMSPDSFVQLSMQLAHYRLYGKIVSQYEPVLTKGFYHGRTEAMRTATEKAARFCEVYLDPNAANAEKLAALRVATQHHSAGIKLAASGKGIERHLFALMKIAEKNGIPTPDFFSSTPYKKLNHTVLSTSNCGNPSLRLFGFGPVVQDGFGIGYIIKDNGLQYSISSKHRQTERFAHTLKQTLIDMGKLLQPRNSVTVTSGPVANARTLSKKAEYLEAWGDTFGEATAAVTTSKKPPKSPLQNPQLLKGRSSRILVRQPSMKSSQIRKFGQSIAPCNSWVDEDKS